MEIDLINYKGIQYIGEIAFGNKNEDGDSKSAPVKTSTFVFDTGSAWTWVSTQDCNEVESFFQGGSNCQNGATTYFGSRSDEFYNHKLSKTYKQQIDGHLYPIKQFYGLGSISGFMAQDTITIKDKVIYPYKFLAVHEAKSLTFI